MRWIGRVSAVMAMALLASVAGAGAAAAQSPAESQGHGGWGHEPEIVDATVITEVTPVGYKVTGIAVKYNRLIVAGWTEIDEAAFAVDATLTRAGAEPVTGPRTIVDAYTNREADFADHQTPGRWVVLELSPDDDVALSTYSDGFFTGFYELAGAYQVEQVGDINLGYWAIPAQPGTVIANTGVRDLLVEAYAADSFEATNGVTLPYRFFTPKVRGRHSSSPARGRRKYPLVVTLHGFGESGTNNFSQIAGNQISVAFADPARQAEHPAFVLSPQADRADPGAGGWWAPDTQHAVVELVNDFVANHPAVDPDRVYLTGLSMGSFGSWGLLPSTTDLFAAALLVCGAGDEDAAVDALGDLPIWSVHSIDDFVVPYDAPGSDYRIYLALEQAGYPVTWSEWSGLLPDAEQEAAAAEARQRATGSGSRHLFTTLPEGTTPVLSHFAWVPTYTNDVIIDWLYSQRLGTD